METGIQVLIAVCVCHFLACMLANGLSDAGKYRYHHRGVLSTELTCSLLWTPAQRKRASMLYFANVFFYFFLWPPYSPALVNEGSRKFYTWWTLSGVREVTTWIFSWSSLNYRVGQKVTKFGVFSDPTRKLSALTPERGRIL